MINFMQSVFGIYVPSTGDTYNFEYIGAVVIFCIVLWGTFKVLSAVFRRK